jgi:hypothetical protein
MSAFQAGKCTAQPCKKLAGTIAKSVVIVDVNNNKQQLQVCYPIKLKNLRIKCCGVCHAGGVLTNLVGGK